jgi:hypothetical protein
VWWNGRHSRFKIYRSKGREGSTPFTGTIQIIYSLSGVRHLGVVDISKVMRKGDPAKGLSILMNWRGTEEKFKATPPTWAISLNGRALP